MNRIYAEQNRPTESYLPTEAPSLFGRHLRWVSAVAAVCVFAVVAYFGMMQTNQSLEQPAATPHYAVTQPAPVTITPASAGNRQRSIRMYDNLIGVSGPASNYRATSVEALPTFHLADTQIESLFVDLQQRMGRSPSRGLRSEWRATNVGSASSYNSGLKSPIQQASARR